MLHCLDENYMKMRFCFCFPLFCRRIWWDQNLARVIQCEKVATGVMVCVFAWKPLDPRSSPSCYIRKRIGRMSKWVCRESCFRILKEFLRRRSQFLPLPLISSDRIRSYDFLLLLHPLIHSLISMHISGQ